jgi:hypothetical protein
VVVVGRELKERLVPIAAAEQRDVTSLVKRLLRGFDETGRAC